MLKSITRFCGLTQTCQVSDISNAISGIKILGESEYNEFGYSVADAGDFNGDGISDLIVGAYKADPNGLTEAGTTYVLFGNKDNNAWGNETLQWENIITNKQGIKIAGEAAYDQFGISVSNAGDFNGDGVSDLIVGAYGAGAAYVLFGNKDNNAWGNETLQWENIITNKQGIKIAGEAIGNWFGASVSNAGDFNGDGFSDLIVGALYADNNGETYAGAAYVLFGSNDNNAWGDGTLQWANINQNKQGIKIAGEATGDQFGISVSYAGDFNGDGISDLIVGAYRANPNGRTYAGAAYILFGSKDNNAWNGGTFQLANIIQNKQGVKIAGEAGNDHFGKSVSYAGDFNGDGISDLIVGAEEADPNGRKDAGAAYVLFGSKDNNAWGNETLQWANIITNKQGIKIAGEAVGDGFGKSVSYAGDFNGDGISDLIIGAEESDPNGLSDAGAGAAYVLFGSKDNNVWGNETLQWANIITNKQGLKITGETAGNSFGKSVSYAGDFNADGVSDLFVGAYGADPSGRINAGAAYVVFGVGPIQAHLIHNQLQIKPSESFVLSQSNLLFNLGPTINGELAGDYFGTSISYAGDFNGDGLSDIIIGASDANNNGLSDAGAAYVLFGSKDNNAWGDETLQWGNIITNKQGIKIAGEAPGDWFGSSVSNAGDFNGDGFSDLIVGAYEADPNGLTDAGAAYVLFGSNNTNAWGNETLQWENIITNKQGIKIAGEAAADWFGASVSYAGDFNADGFSDLIVGAEEADPDGRKNAGAVYVLFGSNNTNAWGNETFQWANISQNKQVIKIAGEATGDWFGSSVSNAGDFNGDGISDLIVGAYGADPNGLSAAGAAYVLFGSKDNNAWRNETLQWSNIIKNKQAIKIAGEAPGDWFGSSVSNAGDFNGDGISDLIIGVQWAEPNGLTNAGAAYVLFGSKDNNAWGDGNLQWANIIQNKQGIKISGEAAGDWFGSSVSNAGDFNGDGISDLIVGAEEADPNGRKDAGAAYVLFGSNDTNAWGDGNLQWENIISNKQGIKIAGEAARDYFGRSISNAGDFNGDGVSDLIVGALQMHTGKPDAAYFVFGTGQINPTHNPWSLEVFNASHLHFERRNASGDFVSLNSSFTQEEINRGAIRVIHSGYNTPHYSILIKKQIREEQYDANTTLEIHVHQVLRNELFVNQGASVVLNTENINATDPANTPSQVIFKVFNPIHGQFQKLNPQGQSPNNSITEFTQQDLIDGSIVFHHDNSNEAPSYSLRAEDIQGDASSSPIEAAKIDFNVSPQLELKPFIVDQTLDGMSSCNLLTKDIFMAQDPDTDHDQLFFETANQTHGVFSNPNNASQQWRRFSKTQLINGHVQFCQDGSDNIPTFALRLNDTYILTPWHNVGIIFNYRPQIHVTPEFIFDQDKGTTIKQNMFNATDKESRDADLLFSVENVTHGFFAYSSVPDAEILEFTQLPLILGFVQFIHNGSEQKPEFMLRVSNGKSLNSVWQKISPVLNLKPEVQNNPPNQNATQYFGFFNPNYAADFHINTFGNKSSVFFDNDDKNLTIQAQLPGDNPLPDWLEFDPGNGRTVHFKGETDKTEALKIRLIATDNRGLKAEATFNLRFKETRLVFLIKLYQSLSIITSAALVLGTYILWRRRTGKHRHTYPFTNQIRKECNLHFNDFSTHWGDSFKMKIQSLISELEYRHDHFYSNLAVDEKKQFAVCVSEILKEKNLLKHAGLIDGVMSWLFIENRGWANHMDLDVFDNQIPEIANEAIDRWRLQHLNPGFTLVHDKRKDKLNVCCSEKCRQGFTRALSDCFSTLKRYDIGQYCQKLCCFFSKKNVRNPLNIDSSSNAENPVSSTQMASRDPENHRNKLKISTTQSGFIDEAFGQQAP